MSINSKLIRAPFSVLYRILFRYTRNHYGIEIPYSAKIGTPLIIEHQGAIVIHGNSIIGSNCIIRQGVTLGNKDIAKPHDAPCLGNNVNIGAGAKLLGKIHIGDNCSIGANSVVIQDIPADQIAVGIPAKVIKAKR